MVVQHNLTAMNSNRMLGLTTSAQAKSTEKLSSGYKINRAADDAAGLSISEKMRKQIRGLSQASLNAQDGISSVQTAEGALNEVQDMLQRMNELAVKAANGTMSEDDRSYIQDEIKQLETEIDRVAETTKFNETYLLKGDVLAEKTYTASMVEANKATSFEALREGIKFYKKGEVDALTEEEAKAELANGGKLYTDAAKIARQTAAQKATEGNGNDYEITAGAVGAVDNKGGSATAANFAVTTSVKAGVYTYSSAGGGTWTDKDGNTVTGITYTAGGTTMNNGGTITVGTATVTHTGDIYAEDGLTKLTDAQIVERFQAGEQLYKAAATIDTTKAQTEAVADTDYKFENATTATGDLTKTAGVNFYKKDGTTALTDDEIKAELANGNKVYTTSAAQKQDDTNKATDGNGYTYVARNAASSNAGLTNVTADESLAAGVYTFDGTDWTDEKGNKVGADKFTYAGTAAANDTITITDEHVTFTNPVYAEGGSAALTDAEILKAHKAGETLHTVAAQKEAVSGKDYTYKADDSFGLYDVNGNKISSNALDSYFDIDDKGVATLKEGKTLYTDNKRTVLKDADISKYVSTEQSMTAALELKLHVGADATSNNQISLKIDSMSAESLGVKDLKVDGADDKNALEAIETIKAAIQKVSKQRSALGAVQNRLEHTISNLDNVVENTTSAESQIRDTDMATEMVKYSNNNILAQAGQSMLAQANQSNQGVLSLLG